MSNENHDEKTASTYFGPTVISTTYHDSQEIQGDDSKKDSDYSQGDSANSEEQKSGQNSEDALTSIIGEFGLYQIVWSILLGSTGITTGMLVFSNKFFTADVS